jgi:hypothetical protein
MRSSDAAVVMVTMVIDKTTLVQLLLNTGNVDEICQVAACQQSHRSRCEASFGGVMLGVKAE